MLLQAIRVTTAAAAVILNQMCHVSVKKFTTSTPICLWQAVTVEKWKRGSLISFSEITLEYSVLFAFSPGRNQLELI